MLSLVVFIVMLKTGKVNDMKYGNDCTGAAMGHNAGTGNRGVAAHIKGLHNGAGHSGNSVSGMAKPAKKAAPGASESVLKKPRRSHSKPSASMD